MTTPKQALLDGTLEDANDFNDFKELELLKLALEKNSWNITETSSEAAGYNFIKLRNGDKQISLHVYLKKVNWRHRSEYEKAIQFPADHVTKGYEVVQTEYEKTVMLGVYKREKFDDFLICAWQPNEWGNRGKAFNCFIDVNALAEAFQIGFTRDVSKLPRNVFVFRPEFIHYYILNQEILISDSSNNSLLIKSLGSKIEKFPLNQIFYGPPGTGKTFNTIYRAVSIISGSDLSDFTYAQVKNEFDRLVLKGQIQLVTFHQSYSYEEFVEGLKPVINENGDIEYKIVNGVFKNLCIDAQSENLLEIGDTFENSKSGIYKISNFNSEIIEVSKEDESVITLPTKLVKELYDLLKDEKITLDDVNNREKDGQPLQDLLKIKYDKYIFGYNSVLKALLEFVINKNQCQKPNYVLIIDEINRGNISKIFGELITLIEDKKRIGSKDELKAKLTYSESELFGVPDNLYIIGTMNSADRSVALIDTALRRRFTFYEYTANPEKITNVIEGISLQQLLKIINARIEYLLDKDHLIGHSYFLDVKTIKDLCYVFRNNIIPLLEEYFYSDYEKIQIVLGDNKEFGKLDGYRIFKPKQQSELKKIFGEGLDIFDEKQVYSMNSLLIDEKMYDSVPKEFFTSIYSSEIGE